MNKYSGLITCIFVLLLPAFAYSQINDLRLPVIIDADRTDYDGKTSMLNFTGLRLTQGGIGIEADVASSSRMDFDDSIWHFSGNVVFDVNEGHVTCDAADLKFSNFRLELATITGTPATFEFTRAGSDVKTYAEAAHLSYDVARGIIEFSGGATITEGGNQISSESLIYNIAEQRINAASSDNGEDRVTLKYTPRDSGAANDEDTPQNANDAPTELPVDPSSTEPSIERGDEPIDEPGNQPTNQDDGE
ncbi:MAG: hypothetical protein OER97_06400 [Gammaproteobacteria bacterium]|nr:hypothetical protein [Gammaproteobacteria bacterium]